jgi:putative ABC transport system ATP-binding protein
MPLVEIEDLTKTYRKGTQEVPVLRDLSLAVEAGEFLALMGPSGSGKTTLLNLIAGIDRPTSGVIRVGGQDLSKLSRNKLAAWRATHVGYIFQLYNLIPVLTAFENVELPLLLLPLSRSERRRRVQVALDAVGLLDRYDHYPRQLSGGQEQRVAIARAIVADPTILVADEPTGDLDADTAATTLTLLRRLNEEMGKTLVMVTHDPRAAGTARRLVHLEKGKLVDDVAPVSSNGHPNGPVGLVPLSPGFAEERG